MVCYKINIKREKKHELPHESVGNNHVFTDMNEMANKFNRHFISIESRSLTVRKISNSAFQ